MPAPYRRIMPGDWVRLERLINEIFGILNADTTLSDIVLTSSDLQVVVQAVSDIVVVNSSNLVWIESDVNTNTSAIAALIAAPLAAGNDTEVQYNDSGALGASPDLTFDAASSTLAVAGTAQVTRLLAGGVQA